MTDRERIAQLEAAIAELRDALDPQRLKDSMERAWDPRGGEPRLVDSAGRTLDYVPAIQFTGATTSINTAKQRAVVAITPPTLAGSFSPDMNISTSEMLAFYRPTGGLLQAALTTGTNAGSTPRTLTLANADSGVPLTGAAPTGRAAFLSLTAVDAAAGAASTTPDECLLRAQTTSGRFAYLDLRSRPSVGGFGGNTDLVNTVDAGSSSTIISTTSGSKVASITLGANNAFSAGVEARGGTSGTRTIVSDGVDGSGYPLESSFMQVDSDLARQTPMRRVMRGPFRMDISALAAGATTTGIPVGERDSQATKQRVSADEVVVGGFKGASGVEDLSWSWVATGANQITLSVTNNGAVARTAELRVYVISTA